MKAGGKIIFTKERKHLRWPRNESFIRKGGHISIGIGAELGYLGHQVYSASGLDLFFTLIGIGEGGKKIRKGK